jgi:hypothetical protein
MWVGIKLLSERWVRYEWGGKTGLVGPVTADGWVRLTPVVTHQVNGQIQEEHPYTLNEKDDFSYIQQ